MDVAEIQRYVQADRFTFTDHAVRRMLERNINDLEVKQAILSGEIIEEYPDNKYSPSCLIYGQTESGRDLHVQCSLPPQVKIVTTYEPDPAEWLDNRIRRKRS